MIDCISIETCSDILKQLLLFLNLLVPWFFSGIMAKFYSKSKRVEI